MSKLCMYIQKPTQSPKKRKKRRQSRFDRGGNKIHFISLGCPRNLVDSEVMLGILLKAGYEVSEKVNQADYIVINTCGFLEASRGESLETIGYSIAEKKKAQRSL